MKRIPVLVPLIVAAIVLPGYLYLGFRLSDSFVGWALLGIPFILIWSSPFQMLSRADAQASAWSEYVLHGTFASMGVVTYLLVFTALRDLLLLAAFQVESLSLWMWMEEWVRSPQILACTAVALTWGTLRAMRGPWLKEIEVPIADLPAALEGFKIAQISDLHVGPTIRRAYVERLVQATNHLKPDLIALTGDFGDGRVAELRDEASALASLKSTYGSFYVTGNHEYYWNAEEWIQLMREFGINVLLNQSKSVTVGTYQVAVGGVVDPEAQRYPPHLKPDPESVRAQAGSAHFKILLSHRPGLAPKASELGFDLQLSGHTHGGQFFPWTLVARLAHRYFLGLNRCQKMWVYVNAGSGSWGPLLRVGTTPELTLLTLVKETR